MYDSFPAKINERFKILLTINERIKMKSKIHLFVPINIGRNLESLLKRKAPDTEFITPASSAEELKYFAKIFDNPVKEKLPELIVTLQAEIFKYFKRDEVREHFDNINNIFPDLRKDLTALDFNSTSPFIKPLLFVPLIMLINKDVKNPPTSWNELFKKRFRGKILLPDIHTPVSVSFNALMKDMAKGENTDDFFTSLKHSGLPFDVITGVNKGFYDIGILPLPFARYNMGKNIETFIPDEGAIILPQMMFMRKDASEATKEVARNLFGKNIQRFFSQLGALIPVIEEIPLPVELKDKPKFYWENWEWYQNLM